MGLPRKTLKEFHKRSVVMASVSGIIAAVSNDIGVRGVAPEAKIAGFNFIESDQTLDLLIHQTQGDFDIFNYSYGSSTHRFISAKQ